MSEKDEDESVLTIPDPENTLKEAEGRTVPKGTPSSYVGEREDWTAGMLG